MNSYGLPKDYQARETPQYFNDVLQDAHLWQADVYRLAAKLAESSMSRLVDVGCGTGTKLIPLGQRFPICGIDYGANLEQCHLRYPEGEWIEANLETEIIPADTFENAVVICADVIEHLIDPSALIATLRNATETADYVLVSTPDRERMYGGEQGGPPANLAHTREWTLKELASWFFVERLPVVWAGWTISYDNQPDRLNTCLIVLSKHRLPIELPISFQPMSLKQERVNGSNRLKVWMTPTPDEAARDITNAINQIVVRVNKYLPDYGVELVEYPDHAQLFAGHAGQGSQEPIDVAHFHGLYNTAQGSDNYAINREVIKNLKSAYVVTAPSQWIADVLRRDMHIEPHVIGWGVDTNEWTPPSEHGEYILWNKARTDNVSDPQIMLELAARAHDKLFLTTFGNGTPNIRTIGRQPYEVMKQHVRNAALYLSTNVETWGIGLWEAMASGVPILAFRQGAQAEYLTHGVNAFLAEVGDMDGLYEGLLYCLKYRKQLGENARELAKTRPWSVVAKEFASVYFEALSMKNDIRPHQIDPSLYVL